MQKLTIQEMNRLSAEAFREAEKLPLVVVLDNVRSQHNVGAVFRTADAFLLEGLYLCGITPKPDTLSTNNDLHKTALGAEQTVSWQAFAETMDAVRALQEKGYKVYAVEQAHHSITLEQAAEEVKKEELPSMVRHGDCASLMVRPGDRTSLKAPTGRDAPGHFYRGRDAGVPWGRRRTRSLISVLRAGRA